MSSPWSAIAVTCKTRAHADAVRNELKLKQQRGFLPKDIILLCAEDPQEGLGSGGATVNALLVVAEHLSAKCNFTVVSTDILESARILIIHLARYYSHDPCGRAFVPLPLVHKNEEMEDVFTNFDALYHTVTRQLSVGSPPGLWVCSSDMILSLPPDAVVDWEQLDMTSGVCCLSVPASPDYAKKHGVYKIDEKGIVSDIIYKGKKEEIQSCTLPKCGDSAVKGDMVSLVSGIVFFSKPATEKLLSLHTCSPVDACTYMGIDSGVEPIQISLYFDVLLSMAYGVSRADFVCGKRGSSFGHSSLKHDRNMELVRATLWERLHGTEMKAVVLWSGKHRYLDITDTPYQYTSLLRSDDIVQIADYRTERRSCSFIETGCTVAKDCLVLNSLLCDRVSVEEGSCLIHCYLKDDIAIGKNCIIVGLDEKSCENIDSIPDNSFVMGINISIAGAGKKKVFCCLWDADRHSVSDDIGKIIDGSNEYEEGKVSRNDLLRLIIDESKPLPPSYLNVILGRQDAERSKHRTLFTANLFPVLHSLDNVDIEDALMLLQPSISASQFEKWKASWKFSMHDLLEKTDHEAEFSYRKSLSVKIACHKINDNLLTNQEKNLYPLYILGVLTEDSDLLLSTLDQAALLCVSQNKSHFCARVFSCIAEVLALMAGDEAGLRSGPAANKEWKKALLLLERGIFKEGIKCLTKIRNAWLGDPDKLIRAARHYERAEHIFVRHACTTVSKFISTVPRNLLSSDTWLVCECPARIDLAGGWSDTPPICYENGGAVVNVALMLDNKRPIGAKVRFIEKPVIVMKMLGEDEFSTVEVVCEELECFADYCQPQAAGALLKACFVLCEVISLNSDMSLHDQLLQRYGKGLEIQTWSNLPRGSGLGTSSILAGAIIAVLLRAVGRVADTNSVIHAVLMLEQMLTTGGGWQDQVGGMVGGIKIGSSNAELPLKIEVKPIIVSDKFIEDLQLRMKLIYTGKTRLARNMLQDVLRNWYTKKPEIIANVKNLVINSQRCKLAFEKEDLKAVGECVGKYWVQKKKMAPGSEPSSCTEIMRILRPYVHGQTLAGAGGGGFLCIILKEVKSKEFLQDLLKDVKVSEDVVVHDVTVDMSGAQVYQKSV